MTAIADLGLGLYAGLRGEPGNLCLSPYSIWSALVLLQPGARERTKDELDSVLGGTALERAQDLRAVFEERAEFEPPPWMQGKDADDLFGFSLQVANQVWVANGYHVHAAYAGALGEAFGIEPLVLDFAGDPDGSAESINRWASDATRGKIPKIVSAGGLSDLTRLLLANAVYFKAAWASEFYEGATQQRPFHLRNGEQVPVPTMQARRHLSAAQHDGIRAFTLPYLRPELVMEVIVPPREHFESIDASLTRAQIQQVLARSKPAYLDIRLPKFQFRSEFALARLLPRLGMKSAINPDAADFSGVSAEAGLHVGEVLHKTFIDVNEKGTEAAAVTLVALAAAAIMPEPEQIFVDSPFYILIRDVPTNTWLFFARIEDPRG